MIPEVSAEKKSKNWAIEITEKINNDLVYEKIKALHKYLILLSLNIIIKCDHKVRHNLRQCRICNKWPKLSSKLYNDKI